MSGETRGTARCTGIINTDIGSSRKRGQIMIAADLLVRRWLNPVNFNSTRRSIEHEKDKQGGNNAARDR